MTNHVEQIAQDLGLTAGEVNALLTDAERAAITETGGDTPIPGNAEQLAQSAPAPAVTEAEGKEAYGLGQETAKEIENARSASDAVAKELLLRRAADFATRPAVAQFYLDGFAQGLTELHVKDSVIRARKSEAKAVIDAYAKTITEKLDDARARMVTFSGTYHEFITLAREIRGKTTNRASGEKSTVKQKLTETETERAKGLLRSMSAGQAAESAVLLGNHLFAMPDGEMAVIRMVANVYLTQLAMSKDVGVAKWAGDARDRAFAILDAWEKAKPGAQVQTATASIPAPAVQQVVNG